MSCFVYTVHVLAYHEKDESEEGKHRFDPSFGWKNKMFFLQNLDLNDIFLPLTLLSHDVHKTVDRNGLCTGMYNQITTINN